MLSYKRHIQVLDYTVDIVTQTDDPIIRIHKASLFIKYVGYLQANKLLSNTDVVRFQENLQQVIQNARRELSDDFCS